MKIEITNMSSAPVHLSEFYKTLAPAETIRTARRAHEIRMMASLRRAVSEGAVACSFTPEQGEPASLSELGL